MSLGNTKSDGASTPHVVSTEAALQTFGIRREQGRGSAAVAAARAEHGWNERQGSLRDVCITLNRYVGREDQADESFPDTSNPHLLCGTATYPRS
jgi:hypothetical protein